MPDDPSIRKMRDPETGEIVRFRWTGAGDPTPSDLAAIGAEYRARAKPDEAAAKPAAATPTGPPTFADARRKGSELIEGVARKVAAIPGATSLPGLGLPLQAMANIEDAPTLGAQLGGTIGGVATLPAGGVGAIPGAGAGGAVGEGWRRVMRGEPLDELTGYATAGGLGALQEGVGVATGQGLKSIGKWLFRKGVPMTKAMFESFGDVPKTAYEADLPMSAKGQTRTDAALSESRGKAMAMLEDVGDPARDRVAFPEVARGLGKARRLALTDRQLAEPGGDLAELQRRYEGLAKTFRHKPPGPGTPARTVTDLRVDPEQQWPGVRVGESTVPGPDRPVFAVGRGQGEVPGVKLTEGVTPGAPPPPPDPAWTQRTQTWPGPSAPPPEPGRRTWKASADPEQQWPGVRTSESVAPGPDRTAFTAGPGGENVPGVKVSERVAPPVPDPGREGSVRLKRAQKLKERADDLAAQAHAAREKGAPIKEVEQTGRQGVADAFRSSIEKRRPGIRPQNEVTRGLIGVREAERIAEYNRVKAKAQQNRSITSLYGHGLSLATSPAALTNIGLALKKAPPIARAGVNVERVLEMLVRQQALEQLKDEEP